jgi:hypothetical protein
VAELTSGRVASYTTLRDSTLLTRVNLLRTQLMILATSYPTRKVRDLAREMPNLLMDWLHFSLDFVRARLDTDIAAQEAAETTAKAAGDKAQ